MSKVVELTKEQLEFRLDPHTLNRKLMFYIEKSRCVVWSLRDANNFYNRERETKDHVGALEATKREMSRLGIKND